jgi:hypothetical protein
VLAVTPVKTPEGLIVATVVVPLAQVPPAGVPFNVVVFAAPMHTVPGPVIVGNGFTVTIAVADVPQGLGKL